ncbi:MAG: phytanoyl-CoA dioxygenase family protein [Armatimonadota bacterium]|nr:phytanoyl-CoA dioxygenase family protein [Armatimonadota bacterium]
MIDFNEKAQQVHEQGFCVLESLLGPDECRTIKGLLDSYWERRGRPSLQNFGLGIHPALEQIPELASFYANRGVIETIAHILDDEVRLTHTGSRLSEESSPGEGPSLSIDWHNHYAWDRSGVPGRKRVERGLGGVYLDGSNEDVGPLIVLPRKYNNPLDGGEGLTTADWPGQVPVEVPPGSVVIFDTALWHTARRGNRPGIRHLLGAHYQGWSNPRPHPEDNVTGSPAVEAAMEEYPALRGLLAPPAGMSG